MIIPCKWCNGTGRIAVELGSSKTYPCTDCDGTGRIEDGEIEIEPEGDEDEDS